MSLDSVFWRVYVTKQKKNANESEFVRETALNTGIHRAAVSKTILRVCNSFFYFVILCGFFHKSQRLQLISEDIHQKYVWEKLKNCIKSVWSIIYSLWVKLAEIGSEKKRRFFCSVDLFLCLPPLFCVCDFVRSTQSTCIFSAGIGTKYPIFNKKLPQSVVPLIKFVRAV